MSVSAGFWFAGHRRSLRVGRLFQESGFRVELTSTPTSSKSVALCRGTYAAAKLRSTTGFCRSLRKMASTLVASVGDNRRMGTLLIVTGPPGAGKSTVARRIADRFEPSVLVEGDTFFTFLARGAIPPWLPESNEQNDIVTRAAAAATGRYTSGGYMTVYDGVVGPWFLSTFAAGTGLSRLDYLVLLPCVERCVERVATRRGHGFTDEAATRQMHRQFGAAEIDRRHVFVDPPDDPEDVADLAIDALSRGQLKSTQYSV